MNEQDFRDLVRQMLDAQQTYFKKGRKQSDLLKSIELEKRVRAELDAGPEEEQADHTEQLGLFE